MKKWVVLCLGLFLSIAVSSVAKSESSLQQLIDQTAANGTLVLKNQIYHGNIVIRKPITLIGSGNTTIQGDGTGNVIKIMASHVKLENLKVEHSSFSRNSEQEYAGIRTWESIGNSFRNITITDSFHGIYLDHSDYNLIEMVKVTGIGEAEIAGQGNGVELNYSNGNRLIGNQIEQTRDGIYFYNSNDNEVTSNEIQHTRYGLHYMYSDHNQFFKNHFTKNTGGAAIMVSKHLQLRDNEFSFHGGDHGFGILIQESEDIQLENNLFLQNLRGLYVDNAFDNRFSKNRFIHNQVGIELWASASKQVFTQNHFVNNIAPVITVGGQSNNQWSENGRGNDWGYDFPVFDLNQDGIGDTPVTSESSLYQIIKDHELAYLFIKSPAIVIYEKIGQLLHKQEVMFEDPYPLMEQKSSVYWMFLPLIVGGGMVGWFYKRRRFL